MQIAKVQDGSIIEVGDYRDMFPNTSFTTSGPNEDFLVEHGCVHLNLWKPYDKATQQLIPVQPYIEDGKVYTVEVADLPIAELSTNDGANDD